MTISTQQSSQIFLGNGVTNSFNFSFVGDSAEDIIVIYTDADSNVTTLSPSQYTVFLNPPATGSLWGVGGTVTYPTVGSPIASGTSLTISRSLPLTQETSISNQGPFTPNVIESAMDTLEMQIQQVSARSGLFRGTWATGVFYNFGDYIIDGANGTDTGNYYSCVIANTSGTWATDLLVGDWSLVINVQAIDTATATAVAAANTATAQAVIATTQATNAASSATSASNSATSAASSATNASGSASSAASSATSASNSAAIALGSASSITSIMAFAGGNPINNGVYDASTIIQTAIDTISAAGGGFIIFPTGTYICKNVILKSGVTLTSLCGTFGYLASSPVPLVTLKNPDTSGWVLDTTSAAASNFAALNGINFAGGGAGISIGGARLKGRIAVNNCYFNNFANQGLLVDTTSIGCSISNIFTTNCVLDTSKITFTGAVELNGTDHYVMNVEANTGLTALSSASLFIVGIANKSANSMLVNCIGEFSDIGIYESGGQNRYVNCRGDLNWGHGLYIAAGGNTFASCMAINNSQQTTNTYSGFYTPSTGSRANSFSSCFARSSTTNTMKYGFEDLVNGAGNNTRSMYSACYSAGMGTATYSMNTFLGSGVTNPNIPIRPADAATTWNVENINFVSLGSYATPTTVTAFTNGSPQNPLRILGNANVTIQNNSTIKTNTGADIVLAANKIYTFTLYGGIWYQNA